MLRFGKFWIALVCLAAVAALLLYRAGHALVFNNPQRSDVAIVLAGGAGDIRILRGFELLRAGYTRELVLDAPTDIMLGRHAYEFVQEYVDRLPADIRPHVHVCTFIGDSTKLEMLGVWPCLNRLAPGVSKLLIVTSDYHTRRSLSIAMRLFPQASWSAAAAADPVFGVEWWREREWAKTCLLEWQKLVWWQLFERWGK